MNAFISPGSYWFTLFGVTTWLKSRSVFRGFVGCPREFLNVLLAGSMIGAPAPHGSVWITGLLGLSLVPYAPFLRLPSDF